MGTVISYTKDALDTKFDATVIGARFDSTTGALILQFGDGSEVNIGSTSATTTSNWGKVYAASIHRVGV